ncbi:MAG: hypothetical protein EOP06_06335 [Proteobacteria bacterium]|nr:MAG: hypothetical protein EOP06_06335 [Pseudomonadota bacterium]
MKSLISVLLMTSVFVFGFSAFAHDPSHADAHLVFAKAGLHAHVKWEAESPRQDGQESLLILEFRDAKTHQPIEITSIPEVSLWMKDMGHGSAPTAIQRVLDANGNVVTGQYRVSNVFFIMDGTWDVRVSIKSADGSKEMQSFEEDIKSGRSNHGGHH